MELKRVVVTGLGAVTPLGNTPEETWENMVKGVSGAAPITLFDATNFKTQFACEVKNWNPNEWIDRKDARKMDRYAQLAMASAVQGVKDSGLDLDQVDKNRVGVIYGGGFLLCSQQGERSPLLAVLHPEDDRRHRRWTDQHPLRLPRTQLHHHQRLCLFDQCAGRRFQPAAPRQGRRDRGRWCGGCHLRVWCGWLQRHEGPFDAQ